MKKQLLFLLPLLLLINPVNATDIDSCQSLSVSDSYVLNTSVWNDGSTCFGIGASDVELDCAGNTIVYSGAHNALGANGNYDNITIKNCVIEQNQTTATNNGHALFFLNPSNVTVYNNTITTYGAQSRGILLQYVNDSVIEKNSVITTNTNSDGIRYESSGESGHNAIVYFNTVQVSNGHGVYFKQYSNVTAELNVISVAGSSKVGVYTEATNLLVNNNNITVNGTGFSAGLYALIFSNPITINGTISNNQISNINTGSLTAGVDLEDYYGRGDLNSIIVSNNEISGVDSGTYYDLYVLGNWNGTVIKDSNISKANVTNALLIFENTTYGKINYTQLIMIDNETNLIGNSTSLVIISDNYVSSTLDYPATITLYGIGDRGYANPIIYRNNVPCETCVNLTGLEVDNVTFTVTGFSNYSIGDSSIEVIIYSPLNTTYSSASPTASIDLNVSVNMTADTWWYEYDSNGTNITFTPNTTIIVDEGQHNLTVWVNNTFGLVGGEIVYFTYNDTTVPPVPTGAFGFDLEGTTTEVKDALIILVPLIFVIIFVYLFRDTLKDAVSLIDLRRK